MSKEKPETKLCKHCKTEIPYGAKVCPNCRKKQKPGGCLTAIVIFIALVLLISCFGGGDKTSTTEKSSETVAKSITEKETVVEETTIVETTAEEVAVFGVGDTVAVDDGIEMTILEASEYKSDNQFISPADGKIFYKVDVEISNNSGSDTSVSSMLSFEAYEDDYSIDESFASGIDDILSGDIASGKKIRGSLCYELNKDWKTLEIQYKPNVWLNKKIIFELKNE